MLYLEGQCIRYIMVHNILHKLKSCLWTWVNSLTVLTSFISPTNPVKDSMLLSVHEILFQPFLCANVYIFHKTPDLYLLLEGEFHRGLSIN